MCVTPVGLRARAKATGTRGGVHRSLSHCRGL